MLKIDIEAEANKHHKKSDLVEPVEEVVEEKDEKRVEDKEVDDFEAEKMMEKEVAR